MRYARIVNGAVAEYPLFEPELRSRFPNVSFPARFTPPDGYVLVEATTPPARNWDQQAIEAQPLKSGSRWVQAWSITNMDEPTRAQTLALARQRKLEDLAAVRWERETGGMSFNGVPVATDAVSQTKIIGAVVGVQISPTPTLKWKMRDGAFITLTAEAVVALATAMRAHVQACFDWEAELAALIGAAATPDAIEAIDITSGWPVPA